MLSRQNMVRKLRILMEKTIAVLILFSFLAGWVTVIGCVFELHHLKAVRNWPSRKAVLTHSYVRRVYDPPRRYYWRAEIAGRFLDDGQRFGVHRVHYGFNFPRTRRAVEEIVSRYPVKMQLDVYYSPENPRTVILEPDTPATSTWIALLVGLGLGLLPVVLYTYRRIREAMAGRSTS